MSRRWGLRGRAALAAAVLIGASAMSGVFAVGPTASAAADRAAGVAVSTVYPEASYVGQPVQLPVTTTDAAPDRTVTFTAEGLPAGLSIDPATGLITGVNRATGHHRVTVTATDSTGASGSTAFSWYVAPAQVSGRTGTIGHGGTCLTGDGGLGRCGGSKAPAWRIGADGKVRTGDRCLTAGAAVTVSTCDGTAGQVWRVGSFGRLVDAGTGQCLTVARDRVRVETCTEAGSQRWTLPAGPVISGTAGLCADTADGVRVWYCAEGPAQAWTVATDGTVRVGRECLTVTKGGDTTLAACRSGDAQQWRVQDNGTLLNPATGKCLADPGNGLALASRLTVAACQVHDAQLWHVV